MSGSIGGIMQFAPVPGINPTAAYQGAAELDKTRAQTGLIGQQATSADITNQLAKARLDVQLPMIRDIAGAGGGAQGGGAGQGAGGIGQSSFTGAGGTMIGGLGAVPKFVALGVASSNDPAKAFQEALQTKRTTIAQLASSTVGADGKADSAAWNQMVERAFHDGWMDNVQRAQFLNRPDLAQPLLNSFAPPETQPGFRGAVSLAEGTSHAMTTPHEVMVPGPNGGLVPSVTSNAAILGLGQAAPQGSALSQKVQQFENGTGNPAQKNASGPGGTPTSTAVGNHQWTESTWLDAINKYAPELKQGRTKQQLLDLRKNADLSTAIFDARAPELAREVTQDGGQASDASIGLAHFLGTGGARKLIAAPSNALFKDVLPDAAKANPSYANMTTGQVAQLFAKRYGTTPFQPAGAGAAPAAGPATTPGGTPITGVETFNEQQKAAIQQRSQLDTKQIEEDASRNEANVNAGLQANQAVLSLKEMRDTIHGLPTGAWADTRMGLQAFATQFGGPWTQGMASMLTGMDKPTLAKMEEFNKLALNNVVKQEQAIGGARVGAMLTNYFAKASPNINMQQPAIKDIMNMGLVGAQMTRDFADASNSHYNSARDATMESAAPNKPYVRYQPISKIEADWISPTSIHSPDVYAAAAALLNGKPLMEAVKGLKSQEQKVEALRIVQRADPMAAISHPASGP